MKKTGKSIDSLENQKQNLEEVKGGKSFVKGFNKSKIVNAQGGDASTKIGTKLKLERGSTIDNPRDLE